LWLSLKEVGKGSPGHSYKLRSGDVNSGPVRVVRAANGWAVLSAGSDGELRVTMVSEQGQIIGDVHLPKDVAGDTVDLGSSSRGTFVSWISRGKVHIRALGRERVWSRRSGGSNASGTRAVGTDDQCVVAWTTGNAKRPHVVTSDACP